MKRLFVIVFVVSIIVLSANGQETMWTYYDTWCMAGKSSWTTDAPWICPPGVLFNNRGKITHIILFSGDAMMDPAYSPYLTVCRAYSIAKGTENDSVNYLYNGYGNPGGGMSDWTNWSTRGCIPQLIDSCHKVGVKVLMDVNQVDPTGWNIIVADSVMSQTFANALAAYMNWNKFDGVDFNVENNATPTQAQTARFYHIVKRAVGTKLVTAVPPGPSENWYNSDAISQMDYIIPQCYMYGWTWNGGCNTVLGNPALYSGTAYGGSMLSISTAGPLQWCAAGWPKKKIVMLLTNNVYRFTGITSPLSCYVSGGGAWMADTIVLAMKNYGGTDTWDDTYKMSYIHGTATSMNGGINSGQTFYLPYFSAKGFDTVVAWARANGFSNFGLYDVALDARPYTVNPVLRTHAYLSSLLDTSSGPSEVNNNRSHVIEVFQLYQNYPNPFNPATTLDFSLPKKAFVRLTIFNLLGQHIATLIEGEKDAGVHHFIWDAKNFPSGTYFYRLQAGNFMETKKLLLLK